MIVVHHLNNSRSQRVLWLLEELGLDYEVIRYDRDPETMLAPPALRKIHPLGKSPVVVDDGRTLAETGAIIDYLIDRYGARRLIPAHESPDYLQYRYWLHYAEGSAMTPLLLKLIFDRIEGGPAPFFIRPIVKQVARKVKGILVEPQLKTHIGFWEKRLAEAAWFAGPEFTAADIQMSFPVEAAASRAGMETKYPRLRSFLDRTHAMPSYTRALVRGGPYDLAP